METHKDRFQQLIENSIDAILIVDEEGSVLYVNPAGVELFGKEKDELLRQPFGLPLSTGDSEIDIIHAKGLKRTASMRIQKIEWEQKPVFLVTLRDITQQKQNEERLRDYRKFESISIMAGGISHDYNNLLAAIYGNIQLAQIEMQGDRDSAQAHLEEAIKSVEHAIQLTKRFLLLSKHTWPRMSSGSVGNILEAIVKEYNLYQDVNFELSIDDDLWPLELDETMLSQALKSVIDNAIEAISEEGTVRITAQNRDLDEKSFNWNLPVKPGRFVNIQVKDSGPGIASTDMNRIFDPYFSTKERGSQKGMGLGLTTAYSILKNHDGHINVLSKPGEGTTVDLYLPLATRDE